VEGTFKGAQGGKGTVTGPILSLLVTQETGDRAVTSFVGVASSHGALVCVAGQSVETPAEQADNG
jgi:hypothetical protein